MRPAEIAAEFAGGKRIRSCTPYGNGHINDTYKVELADDAASADGSGEALILQRINSNVFKHPGQVMENMEGVTKFIADKMRRAGIDPARRVLHVIRTADDKLCYIDDKGEYWRACILIEDAVCYEKAESDAVFRESAVAFGSFFRLLGDYPVETLHETIPGFHNTPLRLEQFNRAAAGDSAGRAAKVQSEITFLRDHSYLAGRLFEAAARGDLPLRVTHNDTKLNNVLIDRKSGKWLCVLDLDTVMPGFSVTDFGDTIRFGASTAAEDEPDISKVHFDRHLYDVYREGFLEGGGDVLTPAELRMLPDGAMVITYEQALRFLADYLDGDIYYKTSREDQNLDRARTQIRLLEEMEAELKKNP